MTIINECLARGYFPAPRSRPKPLKIKIAGILTSPVVACDGAASGR
jgi:hypothetical protein